ncbi:MAG: serine/threonine-protein kinase, partial [Planctomycetota bacterium]
MMRPDDDAGRLSDRLIDMLLYEVAGGEGPPDLAAKILSRAFPGSPTKARKDALTAPPREVYKTPGSRGRDMPESVSIPGYELIETIGAGSSGTVYKARQISMDRLVAIKVLPQKLAQDERFTERFMREARAVAKLNHPNVVTGIDVGEAGGVYYFVMEYVDGESVADRVRREGTVPEKEALEIARQVCLALDCAFKNGIVHRDIKPANILLTRGGEAKLADLGVARHAETEGVATRRVFGTPYYMSPEQARGDAEIDTRSDIYSLGATLYHLLGGKPPFHGNAPKVVMTKQVSEE